MLHHTIHDLVRSARNHEALHNSICSAMQTTGRRIIVLINAKYTAISEVKTLSSEIFSFLQESASEDVRHSLNLGSCVHKLAVQSKKNNKVEPISTETVVQCMKQLNKISAITTELVKRMNDLFNKTLLLLPRDRLVRDVAANISAILHEEEHRLHEVKDMQNCIYVFNS